MFASKDVFLTPPSAGGYTIARSVRLRSSATAYFNRTFASNPTTRTTCHWHWIVKRGKLGSDQRMFSGYGGTSGDSTFLNFKSDDTFQFNVGGSNGTLVSNAVFRDPSAWYIFDLAFDSTQATASNRAKFWVNGVLQTWAGGTVTLNSVTEFALANANNRVGSNWDSTLTFDGYLTEINFIDGQALTPSSFGTTNAITGVWQPAKYTGTYGTNGFYLNFSDNSNNTATTIGKDYSGNGNNWTPNNISVTAGATYDSMVDSPTVSATSSNYCVLNPLQPASTTVVVPTDGNLKMTGTASGNNVTGTMAIGTTTYFEGTVITGGGTVEFGVKNLDTGNTYVYDSNGNKYLAGTGTAYGATFTSNDIIGVAVDPTNLTLQFYKNNTSQGVISSAFPSGNYVPFFYASNTNASAANFGQRPFSYTPPTGYVALNTYNLPASTITNGAAYMAATTWTGTGTSSAITITNGGNNPLGITFQPDFVWGKSRSLAYNHQLYDSVRGTGKLLISNTTDAEQTNFTYGYLSSFNSNGFSTTPGATDNENWNQTSATYVAWQWKAGGTSSSNTNGSITSTVSVGATQGFSVVTYTGNGSTSATVGHGLGVTPSMLIIKTRTGGVENWCVWHQSLGASNYFLRLNSTDAVNTSLNNRLTGQSSTTFTLGNPSNTETNGSGYTYVAYCFAAVAGYSAFGSYTGNGSADGPFVFTNFRPRWVMIKRTDSANDWFIIDTSRNTYNVAGTALYPNSSSSETSNGFYDLDVVSNGFKVKATNAVTNASGGTYIYAAFAESPFKTSLAR